MQYSALRHFLLFYFFSIFKNSNSLYFSLEYSFSRFFLSFFPTRKTIQFVCPPTTSNHNKAIGELLLFISCISICNQAIYVPALRTRSIEAGVDIYTYILYIRHVVFPNIRQHGPGTYRLDSTTPCLTVVGFDEGTGGRVSARCGSTGRCGAPCRRITRRARQRGASVDWLEWRRPGGSSGRPARVIALLFRSPALSSFLPLDVLAHCSLHAHTHSHMHTHTHKISRSRIHTHSSSAASASREPTSATAT